MASTGSGSVFASPELEIRKWGIDPSTVLEIDGLVTALFLLFYALTVLGDALRDALDPRVG